MDRRETRAPAGAPGRKRRRHGSQHRATVMRLRPDVHEALEAEARRTGRPKVAIVDDLLAARYDLDDAA